MDSQEKVIMNDGAVHASKAATSKAKRALDLAVALVALLLLSPVFVLIAVAVKLSSPGPVLFKQKRSGLNGMPFEIYKFRSMKVHSEEGTVTQAKKNDDRITRIGRFIRRTSLDELPQFINVLRGEMSVVGPRPHALAHDEYYGKQVNNYSVRLLVKPGITGLAQITGHRGETETIEKMKKRIDVDIKYVLEWSLLMDIKLIVLTPLSLFDSKAY